MAESAAREKEVNLILELSATLKTGMGIPTENSVEHDDWYRDVCFFLKIFQAPPELDKVKVRALKPKAMKYCLNDNGLFWKDPSGILLKCLVKREAEQVIFDFHEGICGGHHFWKTTAYKILRAGYFWPTLFTDVRNRVISCEKCQRFSGKQKLQPFPLKPVRVTAPFQQWALDFIGEIHPPSSGQHRWILTATDYFTKWIEAIPTRRATDKVIIDFLEDNILSRFGCPEVLVTDNARAFKSSPMMKFCEDYGIKLRHSTAYYPQGNGQAESSNKSVVAAIKKTLENNKRAWDSKLKYALWADRVCTKRATGTSPFQLVYGT